MKTLPTIQHPDVTYWSCPEGDADVTVRGESFRMLIGDKP